MIEKKKERKKERNRKDDIMEMTDEQQHHDSSTGSNDYDHDHAYVLDAPDDYDDSSSSCKRFQTRAKKAFCDPVFNADVCSFRNFTFRLFPFYALYMSWSELPEIVSPTCSVVFISRFLFFWVDACLCVVIVLL